EHERMTTIPLSSPLGPMVSSASYRQEDMKFDLETLRNLNPEGECERLRALYRLFTLWEEVISADRDNKFEQQETIVS
ncbi:unnamed protein product, partial [Allacma fusca]